MIGENNAVIPIAFDTCSSYTIFDRAVPGQMLRATQVSLPDREIVKGIGGIRQTENWLCLLPLADSSYQLVTAQTIGSLLEVKTLNTTLGATFLKQEAKDRGVDLDFEVDEAGKGRRKKCTVENISFYDLSVFCTF